jgi:hypothetical protein
MKAWLAASIVLVLVGVVLLAVTDDTVPSAIGFASAGLGFVLLTGLAFFLVGRSEDRARESERRPPT